MAGGQLKSVESFWTEFDVAQFWNWLISWTRPSEIAFKRCQQMSFIYLQSVCMYHWQYMYNREHQKHDTVKRIFLLLYLNMI